MMDAPEKKDSVSNPLFASLNFIDLHPYAETSLPRNEFFLSTGSFDHAKSIDDGVYALPGFPFRAADGSQARFMGHRPGTKLRWQATSQLWFQADYGIFYFLKERQSGGNPNCRALWAGTSSMGNRPVLTPMPILLYISPSFRWLIRPGVK
jgi:hypothetical protein